MKAFQNTFALASLVAFLGTSHAFVPNHALTSPTTKIQQQLPITAPRALPVDQLTDAAVAWDQVIHQASILLAADGETAKAAGEATGWWGSYINLFKSTLLFVHGTIDAPLRSVGFDQTWGVSIGIFTLMVRSLLIPISVQQSQSTEYQKALKPYVAEIKKRFKDSPDAQSRALGKLYEDADQNPLSGCLMSLVQLPVFLGLYRGVRYLALEGELDEKFLWIPSLAGPVSPPDFRGLDWITQGWTTIDGTLTPPLGWETTLSFMIMPVVLVLLQSATMRILQPPLDEGMDEKEKETMQSTQTALKFLPLLIGFFSMQVPAGLTIYWFASNLFTVTQSLAVRAYYEKNPPKIELPEYWEKAMDGDNLDFATMTPEERRKASEAGLRLGPTLADMKTESKFHVYVERRSFREETPAWKRVQEQGVPTVPEELRAWANLSTTKSSETVEA